MKTETNNPTNPTDQRLSLSTTLIPHIEEDDFIQYLKKIEDGKVTERILKELDVRASTKNYHNDFYSKIKHYISKEKERFKLKQENTFFDDKPMFNTKDLNKYVIILGSPFVESSKQEKFRTYLTTKSVLTEFAGLVKEIYFPYSDDDKERLEKGAVVVVEVGSIEEARLMRVTVDGKFIMKNNQATALLFNEYLQLKEGRNEESLLNAYTTNHDWELLSLEESLIKRTTSSFQQLSFHYLKKSITPTNNDSQQIHPSHELTWSPNGTYLVQNTGVSLIFYSGNSTLVKVAELTEHCKKITISPNEKYCVSFLGLGNTNLLTSPEYIRDLITRQNIFIYSIVEKDIIKSLRITNDEDFANIKFSHDSGYMSRLKAETLIVYEAPEFKMLMDYTPEINKRHPLTDKVTRYEWFPNKNIIMTIYEVRKNKNLNTTIDFYEIPSRNKCNLPIPLTNMTVISAKWHPNGNLLMLLLKSVSNNEWSVKIIDFNFKSFTHKSESYDVVKSAVRVNKDEPMTEKDIDYNKVEVFWADNGNDILISATKRLIIPVYSLTERKYLLTDNGHSVSIIMFSFSQKGLKLTPWPEDKNKKNLKFDSLVVSPTSKNIIVFNKRFEERNTYGEGLLYSVDGGVLHEITKLSFGDKFSGLRFDGSGRFFAVEMCRGYMGNYVSQGFKVMYVSGELLCEVKDEGLKEVLWRPRHTPISNLHEEVSEIKKDPLKSEAAYKMLEEEDSEFLSELDKEKRRVYEEGKSKLYSVINRRTKQWNDAKEERSKISTDLDLTPVEYYIYKEETVRFEEKEVAK